MYRPFSTYALLPTSVGFTYRLQQQKRAVLAGHSAPMQYSPSRSDSLTYYSSKGVRCQPPRSTHAPLYISAGFTYFLQQQKRAALAGYSVPAHYSLSWSDSHTCYSSKGGQC